MLDARAGVGVSSHRRRNIVVGIEHADADVAGAKSSGAERSGKRTNAESEPLRPCVELSISINEVNKIIRDS